MLIFDTVASLQAYLNHKREGGLRIGLVPTMGALHEGHLALVQQAMDQNDISICCIFVNPKQFNEQRDLATYPRPIAQDAALLEQLGCDILFWPTVEEVYPVGWSAHQIELDSLAKYMEGEHRPGHFEGMLQVVERLLDIVQPDELIMGQKDFQQFTIVQRMIDQLQLDAELVVAPIVREADGLAMSSRNLLLTEEFRQKAKVINQTLLWAEGHWQELGIKETERQAKKKINEAGLRCEYFMCADGYTLRPLTETDAQTFLVACTAAWAGDVRLIDNHILQWPTQTN